MNTLLRAVSCAASLAAAQAFADPQLETAPVPPGTETPSSGVEMRAEEPKPAPSVSQERDKAFNQRTEKLTKLDAKVADLQARIAKFNASDRSTYEVATKDLFSQRQLTLTSINAIRDQAMGTLERSNQAADDRLKAYEKAIDALKDRLNRAVGRV